PHRNVSGLLNIMQALSSAIKKENISAALIITDILKKIETSLAGSIMICNGLFDTIQTENDGEKTGWFLIFDSLSKIFIGKAPFSSKKAAFSSPEVNELILKISTLLDSLIHSFISFEPKNIYKLCNSLSQTPTTGANAGVPCW